MSYVERLSSLARVAGDFKVASLFACAGGFDVGLQSVGFTAVYANDIDPRMKPLYEGNVGHDLVVGDIRDVKASDIGKVDLITGGFPCVTFSTSGSRKGVEDEINGMLYRELLRIVDQAKPRMFVAENVSGVLTSRDGLDVRRITHHMNRCGYAMRVIKMSAADIGVPQARVRVFFVGTRHDLKPWTSSWPNEEERSGCSFAEAVADLGPPVDYHAVGDGCDRTWALVNATPRPGDYKNTIMAAVLPGSKPSHTLTKAGSKRAVMVDGRWRTMTMRESARIASFPDFAFVGPSATDTTVRHATGNAVCPLVAQSLGRSIAAHLKAIG